MPDFISKLQHKYYEKGEYSDEKNRSLDDTLLLIKDFPWDQERGVDIQLTCPSVVIQDEYTNYLKIAIYFNGKYCLYYFDCDHHLYEYHTAELKDVYEMVTEFFDSQIELQKFEKKTFAGGASEHFENRIFEYTVNSTKFFALFVFIIVLNLLLICSGLSVILLDSPLLIKLLFGPFFLVFVILIWSRIYLMLKIYNKTKNLFISVSSGNDAFRFGPKDDITTYNKKDINNITVSGISSKGSQALNITEVNFNNGRQIKFPGLLLDPYVVKAKFASVPFISINKASENRKRLWNY